QVTTAESDMDIVYIPDEIDVATTDTPVTLSVPDGWKPVLDEYEDDEIDVENALKLLVNQKLCPLKTTVMSGKEYLPWQSGNHRRSCSSSTVMLYQKRLTIQGGRFCLQIPSTKLISRTHFAAERHSLNHGFLQCSRFSRC